MLFRVPQKHELQLIAEQREKLKADLAAFDKAKLAHGRAAVTLAREQEVLEQERKLFRWELQDQREFRAAKWALEEKVRMSETREAALERGAWELAERTRALEEREARLAEREKTLAKSHQTLHILEGDINARRLKLSEDEQKHRIGLQRLKQLIAEYFDAERK